MEPDDGRHAFFPSTPDRSSPSRMAQPGDAISPTAASLQPLQDGAHAAASAGGGPVPVDMYSRPAAFLPVTWSSSSFLGGDAGELLLASGEPVIATIASASAIVLSAGAPVATSSAPTYGNTYYVAADVAAAHGHGDAVPAPAVQAPAATAAAPPRPTYLYLFYGDAAADGTVTTLPLSSTMSLVISPGSAVAGSPAGEWGGSASQILLGLADHIMTATQSTRLGVSVNLAAQHAEIEDDQVPHTCQLCAERHSAWFVPCCKTVLCDVCSLHFPVECDCGLGVRPVPIPPIFTRGDGQPVPQVFVHLQRPVWQIYRYLEGPTFVMISFYNTASAYLRPDLGVLFETHIYRREGEDGWAWRVEFSVEIPPVDPLHIFWRVIVAPHHR